MLKFILFVLGGVFAIALLFGQSQSDQPALPNPPQQAPATPATSPEPPAPAPPTTPAPAPSLSQQWSRVERLDEVSGQQMVVYSLRSQETLSLSFPYQGRNYGRLAVRQHPRFGVDAYITVEKGLIVCSHPTCAVAVRFDDDPVQSWQMSEPTDRSSTLLFFEDSERFIAAAKQARQIFVELTFFQDGVRTMRFETDTPLLLRQ